MDAGCDPAPESPIGPGAIGFFSDLLTHVTSLRGDGVGYPVTIARGDSLTLMVTESAPDVVSVFDASGQQVASLGNRGQGPGEFSDIHAVAWGIADTIHVFDASNGRWTALARESGTARTISMGVVFVKDEVHILGDGRLLIAGERRTSEHFGMPVHLYDAAGRYLKPLTRERVFPLSRTTSVAHVAPTAGGFWVAYSEDYVIERWDFTGSLLQAVTSRPPYFRAAPQAPQRRASEADLFRDVQEAFSSVADISQDERGRLWVLVRMSDPRYKDAVTASGRIDPPLYLDSVIDVYEPGGTRLVSVLMTALVVGFAPMQLLAQCNICDTVGGTEHQVIESTPLFGTVDDTHGAWGYDCPAMWNNGVHLHDYFCGGGDEEDKEALTVVETLAPEVLARLLERNQEWLTYVPSRGAVQVRGCDGTPAVAQINLTPAQDDHLRLLSWGERRLAPQ